MGKAKKKKFRPPKQRPTGLPSVKETIDDEEENVNSQEGHQTISLLEKLQSGAVDERECTCLTISNVIEDKKSLDTLLMHGLVKNLSPLLLDDAPSVREASAGALRNMSVHGPDICEKMIEDDVMTPVVAFLEKHTASALNTKPSKQPEKEQRHSHHLNTLLQIVHILLNLCETNNKAVNIINKHSVVNLLLECVKSHQVSLDIAVASAQCLQTVTEDNQEAIQICIMPESKALLENTLLGPSDSMQHALLQTHIAGTFFNMKEALASNCQNQTLQAVVKVISDKLSVGSIEIVRAVLIQLQNQGSAESTKKADNAKPPPDEQMEEVPESLEDMLKEALAILTAQQVALEIISNMCCPEDDNLDELDSSSSSSDDFNDDHVDVSEEGSALMSPLCLSAEVHGLLIQHELPKKVLDKTNFPDSSLLQGLLKHKEGKPLFKGLLRVQSRALFCLQNIVSSVDVESLGGTEALTLVLGSLMALVMRDPAPKGDELIESLTAAVRAVLQKMAQEKVSPKDLSETHLVRLGSFVQGSSSEAIKVNTVGILGSVGNLLATQQGSEQVLQAVGERLLEVSTRDPSLWVVAEALDAIFDTFGDGQMADVVADRIELLPKLKTVAPKLKAKLKQTKGNLGEHLPVVMNARTNLLRFIKYKEQQAG